MLASVILHWTMRGGCRSEFVAGLAALEARFAGHAVSYPSAIADGVCYGQLVNPRGTRRNSFQQCNLPFNSVIHVVS